jgi:hypothetical protein
MPDAFYACLEEKHMAYFETGTTIEFGRREAVTLNDVRGTILRVKRGTIWVTQEHDTQDIVLRAGDSWVVETEGATVIEAQDAALVQVVDPALSATSPRKAGGFAAEALARLWNPWIMRSQRQVPYY